MLVISRKRNEKIRIEGPATITVVDMRGDKVRIGIEAERSVLVIREELGDVAEDALRRRCGERSAGGRIGEVEHGRH
jgi:carbon storage regulator